MPTQSRKQKTLSPSRYRRDRLGYDFALLGLSTRESRGNFIRRAAKRTASQIRSLADVNASQQTYLLGELAASTYRLLDPRRRRRMAERVQLCVYTELDFELQKLANRGWFDADDSSMDLNVAPEMGGGLTVRPKSKLLDLTETYPRKESAAGTSLASALAWLVASCSLAAGTILLIV